MWGTKREETGAVGRGAATQGHPGPQPRSTQGQPWACHRVAPAGADLGVGHGGDALNVKELSRVVLHAANENAGDFLALALQRGHNVFVADGMLPLPRLDLNQGVLGVVAGEKKQGWEGEGGGCAGRLRVESGRGAMARRDGREEEKGRPPLCRLPALANLRDDGEVVRRKGLALDKDFVALGGRLVKGHLMTREEDEGKRRARRCGRRAVPRREAAGDSVDNARAIPSASAS